ncbi:MAG: hypothetical protein EOT05_02675 [Candidatus Microsaccharimonas sossegonensis]|uniref:Spore Coat Protein U domain protein n=1 Tax=Candidatus Microsaccharimonas sossegonensis TaxID=2506948 RepID=A0A4Q0AHI0_9BACT|nr:MAG: hypothetical protein EOT05_02675 [Candidatus Microsaccharimonas sossegonensis]
MTGKQAKGISLQQFAVIAAMTILTALGSLLIPPSVVTANDTYGSGSYGSCTYNSCGITFSADAAVSLNVTPAAGLTQCSVASATVQVQTDSSTGYTLSMTDTDTDTTLNDGGSGSIATTSGTSASPTALTAGKWGYRVDGINGFGAGPTSAVSSGAVPSLNFAAVPASNTTPDTIASSSVAANPAVSTNVWFGLCINATQRSGNYTDSVTYTAVVN